MKINLVEIFRRRYPHAYRKINLFLSGLRDKVENYSVRERVIILAALIMVIFTLWYFAMFLPVRSAAQKYKIKINVMEGQYKAAEKQYREVVKELATTTSQEEQELLKKNLKKIDDRITQITSQVVPADKMADMLKDLLIKEGKLRFIAMKSLPAQTLIASEVFAQTSRMSLLNQGIEITFSGAYFDTLKYLKSLEASKWQFFWNSLSYKVTKYPEAEVKISVHTLVQHKTKAVTAKAEGAQ